MTLSGARPLDPWRWLGLPLLWTLAATVLFALPIRLFTLQLPQPVFPMVLAFAWAVIRPSVLAPFALLFAGLFLDVFWGGAMGLWPVCLLIAYGVVLMGRNMLAGQSRAMMWAWYAGVCGVAETAGFLLTMLDAKATPGVIGAAWQFLATMLLYPFAHRLIDRFEDADVRFR